MLIDHLEGVRQTGPHKWIAKCPAHGDNRPSLSVSETPDGKTLVHCWAGCSALEVVNAVGLELANLFPEDGRGQRHHQRSGRRPMRASPREALQLLRADLLTCGIVLARGDDPTPDELALMFKTAGRISSLLGGS